LVLEGFMINTLKIDACAQPDAAGGHSRVIEIGETTNIVDSNNIKNIINSDTRLQIRLIIQRVSG